jgi:hypothetical protein
MIELLGAQDMAPQSGHVSNFCGSVDPLIEPADVYCFERDSSAPPTPVQGGHPVWTRLELAKGAQGNLRMARNTLPLCFLTG